MARLLIVHHSPTPTTLSLADSVVAGASDEQIRGVEVVACNALSAGVEEVATADAVLLGTTANFGYMSGALKHFFDTIFLEAGGALADDGQASPATPDRSRKPWGLWVHGRYDTTGAVRAVESIVSALPWRQSAPILSVIGAVGDEERAAAYELGGTIAAILSD